MTTAVTIDIAGGQTGGAGRFRTEVLDYVRRASRDDIKVIGTRHHLSPAWLAAREAAAVRRSRRIALNNVGFLTPGGERWTLLANALHFPTPAETADLDRIVAANYEVLASRIRVPTWRKLWILVPNAF